jgi:threonine/homoserine/homoserine lactone efflux protein
VTSQKAIMLWMRRTFAGALVLLGAKLAFTER